MHERPFATEWSWGAWLWSLWFSVIIFHRGCDFKEDSQFVHLRPPMVLSTYACASFSRYHLRCLQVHNPQVVRHIDVAKLAVVRH